MTNPVVWGHRVENRDKRAGLRHSYWCPGCDGLHSISIRPHTNDNGAGWTWDNRPNMSAPTYSPSQLSTVEYGDGRAKEVCHTFIKGGMIEFLSDCTHALKGQTVPMVPLPDWVVDSLE